MNEDLSFKVLNNIFSKDKQKILDIVYRNDPLVSTLAIPNPKRCSLLNKNIIIEKQLGKGQYGTVYEVEIKHDRNSIFSLKSTSLASPKKYVLKQGLIKIYRRIIQGPLYKDDERFEEWGFTYETLISFNPNVDFNAHGEIQILFPKFADECLTRMEEDWDAYPQLENEYEEYVITPEGSYICSNNTYSEYFIGALLGEAYRKEDCIHFFDIYSMFTCPIKNNNGDIVSIKNTNHSMVLSKEYYQYILMDKIDGNFTDIEDDVFFENRDELFLQLLFSIAYYQEIYDISHNDLHMENVFIDCVKEDTIFKGKKLFDATYYRYIIGNKNINIKATPVLLKIGDFGLSVKHSSPIVGYLSIFKNGHDRNDGNGAVIPNHMVKQYDIAFSIYAFLLNMEYRRRNYEEIEDYIGDFIRECLVYLFPVLKSVDIDKYNTRQHKLTPLFSSNGIINKKNDRPILENLYDYNTAIDLLSGKNNNIVQRYFGDDILSGDDNKICNMGYIPV